MDFFVVNLAILLLPGLIWSHVDVQYSNSARPSDAHFVVRGLVFGLASYAVTYLLYGWLGWSFDLFDLAKATTATALTELSIDELVSTTITAFVLSIVWLFFKNKGFLPRFLQKIGVTTKYGDEDIWHITLTSKPWSEYVNVRDYEHQLIYSGWVLAWSDTKQARELLLRDVVIYDTNGNLLSETKRLYLSRASDKITLEFPVGGPIDGG